MAGMSDILGGLGQGVGPLRSFGQPTPFQQSLSSPARPPLMAAQAPENFTGQGGFLSTPGPVGGGGSQFDLAKGLGLAQDLLGGQQEQPDPRVPYLGPRSSQVSRTGIQGVRGPATQDPRQLALLSPVVRRTLGLG